VRKRDVEAGEINVLPGDHLVEALSPFILGRNALLDVGTIAGRLIVIGRIAAPRERFGQVAGERGARGTIAERCKAELGDVGTAAGLRRQQTRCRELTISK
jgi:hypothetical protein